MNGNVVVSSEGITITADHAEGNASEFTFSGHTHISGHGIDSYADAIHFFPGRRTYELDNPRAIVPPQLLRGIATDNVYINGGVFEGTSAGYILAQHFDASTCRELRKHYFLDIGSAELVPYQALTLRHVGVVFFGVKVFYLSKIVIPLNRNISRRPRTNYLPEFGQNPIEGYFARFPYTFAEGLAAATLLRLDVTQLKGEGYYAEQDWLSGKQPSAFSTTPAGAPAAGAGPTAGSNGAFNSAFGFATFGPRFAGLGTGSGPQNGGVFDVKGYFSEGFTRDFQANLSQQQSIGGSNHIAFSTQINNNSFDTSLGLVGAIGTNGATGQVTQNSQTTHFDFSHSDAAHGVTGDLAVGLTTSDSDGYVTKQLTGDYRQAFQFDSSGSTRNSLTYDFDFTRYTSSGSLGSTAAPSTFQEQLASQFQLQHVAREYSLTLDENSDTPLGPSRSNTASGTIERLPELLAAVDTINFKSGWLHTLPFHFDFGVGEYSEPVSNVSDYRALMGFLLDQTPVLKGRTELSLGGGFEQRVYGDGAAQYQLQETTDLRQHLWGRSGIDVTYQYQQSEGGTPFLFDTYSKVHQLTAQAGYLEDRHFQLSLQTGYDLLGQAAATPWQVLGAHLMWRPSTGFRYDATSSYDPNYGKLLEVINTLRWRGPRQLGVDMVANYEPQQTGGKLGKFSEVDSEFDVPIGRNWRLTGLMRYNGQIGEWESRNVQVTRDWDCMEASLTYTESSFGAYSDRQIYFSIRIKALPFFHSFARGPIGQSLGANFAGF